MLATNHNSILHSSLNFPVDNKDSKFSIDESNINFIKNKISVSLIINN